MLKNLFLAKKAVALFVSFCFIMGIAQSAIVARADDTDSSDLLVSVESKTEVPDGYMGIYSAADMELIRSDLTGNYILMSDIDLSAYDNWEPIGDDGDKFTGDFDGNGYTIYNMNITSGTTWVGLFGRTNGATIENLVISNATIKITSDVCKYVSFIVAGGADYVGNCSVVNSTMILNLSSYSCEVGGITGLTNSNVEYCLNYASIDINISDAGTIEVGGIAGGTGGFTSIDYCANKGVINIVDTTGSLEIDVGGIGGSGLGSISCCANSGNITVVGNDHSTFKVGGIVGEGISCYDSYNSGDISVKGNSVDDSVSYRGAVGGIAGDVYLSGLNREVSRCYNVGSLDVEFSSERLYGSSENCVGGIVGIANIVSNCYYYAEIIAQGVGCTQFDEYRNDISISNCTGLSLTDMCNQENYVGFDFVTVWTMGGEDYPYPVLQALNGSNIEYELELAAPYISIEKTVLTKDDGLVKISWGEVENAYRYYINILGSDGIYIEKNNIVSGTETYLSTASLTYEVTYYDIWVYAVDVDGNASGESNHLTVFLDPDLAFVYSLTSNSLANADRATRTSINNAIYNLLFKAQWRPNKNNVNDVDFGSYSNTLSQEQVNASWKNRNNSGDYIYYVTDEGLGGTYKIHRGAKGCLEYARFVSSYVYGVSDQGQVADTKAVTSVEDLIILIHEYADPGEHIRIGDTHSVVFLGEDDEGTGFYCVDYGDNSGTKPSITFRHYTYTDFVNDPQWKGCTFTIWDTNGGSYFARTASDIETVRNKNGVTATVVKLDCPIEVVVTLDGESLSSIGLEDGDTVSTSFGSMQRDGESIIFRLTYSNDYEFEIYGTGEGTMTLTLTYYAGDDVVDTREIVNVRFNRDKEPNEPINQ